MLNLYIEDKLQIDVWLTSNQSISYPMFLFSTYLNIHADLLLETLSSYQIYARILIIKHFYKRKRILIYFRIALILLEVSELEKNGLLLNWFVLEIINIELFN